MSPATDHAITLGDLRNLVHLSTPPRVVARCRAVPRVFKPIPTRNQKTTEGDTRDEGGQ